MLLSGRREPSPSAISREPPKLGAVVQVFVLE
jgi:hypothetical protein